MIKMALVGCGRIGGRHAALIQQYGRLMALCDTDLRKAQAIEAPQSVQRFDDFAGMLHAVPEIELVVICTPNGLHAPQSILALGNGCHVLCEKPMALSTQEAAAMMQAAKAARRGLFIVKQNRFNPPVRAVHQLLEEGRLGRIHSFQLNGFWNREDSYYADAWRGTRLLDGGILFTQFSHFIDLLLWFCGQPEQVSALSENFQHRASIGFEDTCVATARMKDGSIGTLHFTINAFRKNMEGSLTLFGEKGTVKIGGEYLEKLEYLSLAGAAPAALPAGNPANNYGGYQGSMSNHGDVYAMMVRSLGEETLQTNMQEGYDTVNFIEKIYQTIRSN